MLPIYKYHVEYGGLFAETTIISLLEQRGNFLNAKFIEECTFLWTSHSKVPWEKVLQSDIIVSCYPVRTALVRKDALRITLRSRLLDAAIRQGLSERVIKRIRNACPDFILLKDQLSHLKKKKNLKNIHEKDKVIKDDCKTLDNFFEIEQEKLIQKILTNTDDTDTSFWVLKDVSTNNSLGVRFISQTDLHLLLLNVNTYSTKDKMILQCIKEQEDQEDQDSSIHLVSNSQQVIAEEYIQNPVLLSGRKFHLRVNVLAIGNIAIYVHKDVICHCACEPYSINKETFISKNSSFTHITNNCIQKSHPLYTRKTHTILLSEAIFRINKEVHTKENMSLSLSTDSIFTEICQIIRDTFAVLMQGRATTWSLLKDIDGIDPTFVPNQQLPPASFIPNKSSFELFGWDFILAYKEDTIDNTSGKKVTEVVPIVLEVNGGPALEGVAWPMMCRRVLGDALETIETILLQKCTKSDDECDKNNKDNESLEFPPKSIGDFLRVL
jgi:hypothetical protein